MELLTKEGTSENVTAAKGVVNMPIITMNRIILSTFEGSKKTRIQVLMAPTIFINSLNLILSTNSPTKLLNAVLIIIITLVIEPASTRLNPLLYRKSGVNTTSDIIPRLNIPQHKPSSQSGKPTSLRLRRPVLLTST